MSEAEKSSCTLKVEDGSCICKTCLLAQRIPHIPMYAPYSKRDLPEGTTFLWCSCGKSKSDPYCDRVCDEEQGRGDRFVPVECTLKKQQNFYSICGCKYTRSPPFCDGTHATMPAKPDKPPCKCPNISW